ncbi:hypothetical protein [Streptomyces clavuligerus]|nr:hypothetical protein [Streptomyces clavuligerus]MBY6307623.1 hypothetical protein [Streptomyces clavuligerus]QCS09824.1 hypothetical protein CRV15_29910 [Streptomyces clavuligerus]QPJ98133.1 hypothetical protein GE265_34510 [Streptomyces clavuligerus]WDN56530.1 hypothetical protein LL058_32390 [Streptomyces clavuligerus]
MSLRKVLTTAAVSAAIIGAGVMTAPVTQAAEKPSTTATAPTSVAAHESAQAALIWQPTGESYTRLSLCNSSGRYWSNNRPDVVTWDCRLRGGNYYLYLLIDTERFARV